MDATFGLQEKFSLADKRMAFQLNIERHKGNVGVSQAIISADIDFLSVS